jgi:hypothetical protein
LPETILAEQAFSGDIQAKLAVCTITAHKSSKARRRKAFQRLHPAGENPYTGAKTKQKHYSLLRITYLFYLQQ